MRCFKDLWAFKVRIKKIELNEWDWSGFETGLSTHHIKRVKYLVMIKWQLYDRIASVAQKGIKTWVRIPINDEINIIFKQTCKLIHVNLAKILIAKMSNHNQYIESQFPYLNILNSNPFTFPTNPENYRKLINHLTHKLHATFWCA